MRGSSWTPCASGCLRAGVWRRWTRRSPCAPKAGAVVLLDEQMVTVVGSGKLVERRRRAMRVLNASGAEQAVCAASSLRGTREVRVLDAWQVSPDGAVRHFGRNDALDLSEAG